MGLASAYGLKYLENSFFFLYGLQRLGREVLVVFFYKKNPQKTL